MAQPPKTFATLPASPKVRDSYDITDSKTAVYGAIEVGGGTYYCTVNWNGTNWIDIPAGGPTNPGQGVNQIVTPAGLQYTVANLPTYKTVILGDSPAGYWRLSDTTGNFLDSTANGNAAVPAGTITRSVAGAIIDDLDTGAAGSANSQCTVTANASLPNGDVFSVEFWFKRSATQGVYQYVVAQKTTGFAVYFNPGNNIAVATFSGAAFFSSSPLTITDTTAWHHFAFTKNGSVRNGYLDNVLLVNTLANQTVAPPDTTLYLLGCSSGASGANLSVDEIAVYTVALTAAQVASHYNQGLMKKNGSIAYAVDGTPASVPITGGGSGVTATYSGNRWCATL